MGIILEQLLNWFDGFHPFFQSLCAAAAFALVSWFFRKVASKIKKSGSDFFISYQKLDMQKHIIHKELIRSNQLVYFSKGYFIVTLESFRWVFRGVLILVFFLGVSALVNSDWWMLLGYWFLLNCMVEASTWLKDKSSEKDISYIRQDIKEDFYAKIYPKKQIEKDSVN